MRVYLGSLVPKDLKFAARMLGKNPAFTVVAVCSLAIGIGANSAIFSFADALLLRPLPVRNPNGIVSINPGSGAFGSNSSISYSTTWIIAIGIERSTA